MFAAYKATSRISSTTTVVDDDTKSIVFDNNSKPYGLTYGDWTGKWWQWAYSIPKNINPAYDDTGKFCEKGQSGPVWFLTSSYQHPVDRHCTIPYGKSILFTILNSECSYAEFPKLKTEDQLRHCAYSMQNSVIGVKANIDGKDIANLNNYRIQSPLFNFSIPKNNILGLPTSLITSSVSDGNWVFLKPLSIGEHTISFKGTLKNVSDTPHTDDSFTFAGP